VQRDELLPLGAGDQAGQGLRSALPVVNLAGLGAVLIDGQDQAAVEQLLVDLDRGGGQDDRGRSGDP
jgi:hypothetical protein